MVTIENSSPQRVQVRYPPIHTHFIPDFFQSQMITGRFACARMCRYQWIPEFYKTRPLPVVDENPAHNREIKSAHRPQGQPHVGHIYILVNTPGTHFFQQTQPNQTQCLPVLVCVSRNIFIPRKFVSQFSLDLSTTQSPT